jgi:RNA polymerase sigma-70 factor (ECF subfamily)
MDASVIWQSLNTPLERFIRSRVPDEQTAHDLLQDVYLKIHRNIDTLHDDDRMQAWVYQIARNTIHDFYRSEKSTLEITEMLPAPDEESEDEITARLAQSVRRMLDLLSDDYREALLLVDYEGLSQKELAERLGISLSGAKSRVQRGRKMLRELLLLCCHFEFDRLGKVIDYYPRCECCTGDSCGH